MISLNKPNGSMNDLTSFLSVLDVIQIWRYFYSIQYSTFNIFRNVFGIRLKYGTRHMDHEAQGTWNMSIRNWFCWLKYAIELKKLSFKARIIISKRHEMKLTFEFSRRLLFRCDIYTLFFFSFCVYSIKFNIGYMYGIYIKVNDIQTFHQLCLVFTMYLHPWIPI